MHKKTLAEINAALSKQNTLLSRALQVKVEFVVPDAVVIIQEGETKTCFSRYESLQPDGGIILRTFFKQGQRPYTSVMYADDFFFRDWFTHYSVEQVNGLAKLKK